MRDLTPTQDANVQNLLRELRSGNFQQGSGKLRSTADEYCCLGVACNVLDPTRWTDGLRNYSYRYGYLSLVLPEDAVLAAFGLDHLDAQELAELNDGIRVYKDDEDNEDSEGYWLREPKTFAEIADIIEAVMYGTKQSFQ